MNKHEFLSALRARLSALPLEEVLDRLSFYGEMIDDRMEEGLSEEAAVSAVGTVEEIAARILAESVPTVQTVQTVQAEKEGKQARPQSLAKTPGEILLLILGAPLWLPLLLAAGSILLSVYAVLWAMIACVWAVFASLAACAPAGLAAGILFLFVGNPLSGLCLLGGALICAGLAIFAFFGCSAATKGCALLTVQMSRGIGRLCKNRRNAA